jgi:hypothetical protein
MRALLSLLLSSLAPQMTEREQSKRLRRFRGILLAIVAVLGVGAFLVWGFIAGRHEAATEAERERPVKAPVRVSTNNGKAVIRLDAETQQRNGIETAALRPMRYQNQVRAYGMVLDIAKLTDLSNNYISAKAQLHTAQAKVAASKPAFERARELYVHGQVVSQQLFQTAEATFRTDEATVAAAEARVRTVTATAHQDWGPVLGKSLVDGSSVVTRLIERDDFLLQVTLPPGTSVGTPPPVALLQTSEGRRTEMKFISLATRTDPRIQSISFFYTAAADSGVLPGMNVLAFLPTPTIAEGVTVPATAVVWWQDRAWAYRRTGRDTFTRAEISTDLPEPGGGYIVKDLPKNGEIVTRGAQLLLSEEFRAQIQVGGD